MFLESGLNALKNSKNSLGNNPPNSEENQSRVIAATEKGAVYEITHDNPALTVSYKIRLRGKMGSIELHLYHLRKWNLELENKIISTAQMGDLSHSDSIRMKKRNINIKCYTHRLEILHHQQSYRLCWLIDIDFHKPSSFSYGSIPGKNVMRNIMSSLLLKDVGSNSYPEFVENLIQQDWAKMIKTEAEANYECFQEDRLRVIYSPKSFQKKLERTDPIDNSFQNHNFC